MGCASACARACRPCRSNNQVQARRLDPGHHLTGKGCHRRPDRGRAPVLAHLRRTSRATQTRGRSPVAAPAPNPRVSSPGPGPTPRASHTRPRSERRAPAPSCRGPLKRRNGSLLPGQATPPTQPVNRRARVQEPRALRAGLSQQSNPGLVRALVPGRTRLQSQETAPGRRRQMIPLVLAPAPRRPRDRAAAAAPELEASHSRYFAEDRSTPVSIRACSR
jgi:hypothetical protein